MEINNYFLHSRRELSFLWPNQVGKVLEIGCACGQLQRVINSSEYWGIEPNVDAANEAKRLGGKILIGTFDCTKDNLPLGYFDLVIVNDVIEHLPNDIGFLNNIRLYMRHNAFICGSVPNVRHFSVLKMLLIGRDWVYESAGIMDSTHLRWFTVSSLRRTLVTSGFVVEEITGISSGIWFGNTFVKRLKRMLLKLAGSIMGDDISYRQIAFRARLTTDK